MLLSCLLSFPDYQDLDQKAKYDADPKPLIKIKRIIQNSNVRHTPKHFCVNVVI